MTDLSALEVCNTFTWANNGDKQKTEMILAKFKTFCILHSNVTWKRHMFNTCNQSDDETIDQYYKPQKEAQTCEFQGLKDGLIQDRVRM